MKTTRTTKTDFKTREEDNKKYISGYFVVFDDVYEIGQGMTESIDRSAFDETLNDDVRALFNHDTNIVLGRTKAKTLQNLHTDNHGLYGDILINENDSDAMNAYARVSRGDIDQCSFGFDILNEDTELRDDGTVHWTIRKVKLYEVSPCTFPAYESTSIVAREKQVEELKRKKHEAWKIKVKERLKNGN